MKQRISVRAVIRDSDKLLLIRRATGRQSIMGHYELPGGKLAYGEQPEDALRRYLHDEVGLHMQTVQLFDAVTYIDRDDRDIQYAIIMYEVELAEGNHGLRLGQNYDKHIWTPLKLSQHIAVTDLSQLLLGIIEQNEFPGVGGAKSVHSDEIKTTTKSDTMVIYSDGGSRGNPGPSAAGYVIMDQQRRVVAQGGVYLGITTNNQAEYHGVRLGLEKAKELGIRMVDFRIDSMLVVNQMKGVYRIKNRDLWPIHERIRELVTDFDQVVFSHVRREHNQLADGVVNRTLDAHANEQ